MGTAGCPRFGSRAPSLGLRQGVFVRLFVLLVICLSPSQGIRFMAERETYAKYPKWDACTNASITFEFKTRQKDGMLMYTDDNASHDYMQVAITEGAVKLWINFVREEEQSVEIELGKNLNDDQWHRVEVKRHRMETTLLVDNTQSSKVSFGEDFTFGEELETNNYVYFGGVPSNFTQELVNRLHLPPSVYQTKFRGDIRNILYFNCSCMPVRASKLEGRGVSEYPKEACDVRNPCAADCPCISSDDGPGCECEYRQECVKDLLAHYRLPMDVVERDLIRNPSGLDSRVYGSPQLVTGVHNKAVRLDGRTQWVKVSGRSHKRECFGDLDHCPKGYFLGMWLRFESAPSQPLVYLSNGAHRQDGHGVAMTYSKDGLEFSFKKRDGKLWKVKDTNILPKTWYHVAASWEKDKGLYLYVNGHQVAHDRTPQQSSPASVDNLQYSDFVIGRSNDRSGTERLTPVLVDDFNFMSTYKDEESAREAGPAFHYFLSMDRIYGNEIAMIGGRAIVHGPAQNIPGKIGQAVSLSGRGDYLDLGDAHGKCLGDLDLCKNGIYLSFFVRFPRLDNARGYLFSTPFGLNVYQSASSLVATAQKKRRSWEATYRPLRAGRWYFIEVSWSEAEGIALYVNGKEVARQGRERLVREIQPSSEMKALIGRKNGGSTRHELANAALDHVDIYYSDRNTLTSVGLIERGTPSKYYVDFEDIRGDRVSHDSLEIRLRGSPEHVEGKIGRAIRLDGDDDVVNFGDHSSDCLGNLDLCHHGVMYSFWMRPDRLKPNMYFLSTGRNGITLKYRGRKLHAIAETTTRKWEASTSNIEADKWYFVEISYHPLRGLSLYINNQLLAQDLDSAKRTVTLGTLDTGRFYLGRGNVDMGSAKFGAASFDELEMWYADRDYLTAHNYIQRSQPRHFFVEFEELIDENRVMHNVLSIRLVGRPMLIPGKVNNALELSGRGQYADLGARGEECMANLAQCKQGITVAAWMRFHRFENNMVFLSTGENGILMKYRNGFIEVTADGRGLISVPRLDLNRWYFIEVTWHPESGLKMYVDNTLRGSSGKDFVSSTSPNRGSFFIGRPNRNDIPSGRFATGNFDVDEMEIWYGKREDLLAFDYIDRESNHNLGYEYFSMDAAEGQRLVGTKYIVLLVNGAGLIQGKSGNAIFMNGQRQYINFGRHFDKCFGNIDLCSHGVTFSLWVNPRELTDSTYVATPTYNLYYRDGQLRSDFRGENMAWTTSTPRLRAGEWQRVTLAWHPKKGLTMYINDELVSQDRSGQSRPDRGRPRSENIYIGRSLDSEQNTANLLADEFQVWYDDLDQLRATGQYRVQVVPRTITFDDWTNNMVRIRDHTIRGYGDIRIVPGRIKDTRAIYLPGRSEYLDLGSNFTCGGDLETCRQGATLRLGIRPTVLRDGMVFLDSWPVRLYYKDGRLYGVLRTATHTWDVSTPELRPGQWQRVELTWHPRDGLIMYLDGRRVAYQTYGDERTSPIPADWRTYFGRALQGGQTYANVAVDNIEFWQAYRDHLPTDIYIETPPYEPPTTPRPRTTRRPVIRTPRPDVEKVTSQPIYPQRDRDNTTIMFNGRSYVQYNFNGLERLFLQRASNERFQFYFKTRDPDGLIWFHEEDRRKMYIALRDGYLVFSNDDGSGSPEEIVLGRLERRRFNDGDWHLFKLQRKGQRIVLTVDGGHRQEYIFSNEVQFVNPIEVYLGGTSNPYSATNGQIRRNFRGTLFQIVYNKEIRRPQENRIVLAEVNLITRLDKTTTDGGIRFGVIDNWPQTTRYTIRPPSTRTTPRPPTTTATPQLTSITLEGKGIYMELGERFQIKDGSSISFRFQTIKPRGLLVYTTSNIVGRNFFALEIFDGKLYAIYNFGGRSTKRLLLSNKEVSDGQPHEVEVRFENRRVYLKLDDQTKQLKLDVDERYPGNQIGKLYFGGYRSFAQMPWHTWARENYEGCLEDLQISGRTINLHHYTNRQTYGMVKRYCAAMPQQCNSQRPCVNGICHNMWGGYYCDCRHTDFMGDRCSKNAWTAMFNGSTIYTLTYDKQQRFHVDDISFRFKTMASDGLIFKTKAQRNGQPHLRADMDNGQIVITTDLGGQLQSFKLGENLNDYEWHTVYIQRRGNQLVMWVDNMEPVKKTLPGNGYYLNVKDIFFGGHEQTDENYIGYLRNFYIGREDIFNKLHTGGGGIFYVYPDIPNLIFGAVTIPNYDAHITLPGLQTAADLNINFEFKTRDPKGIILYNEGSKEQFAVELFEGRLQLKLLVPGKLDLDLVTPEPKIYNDGKWHSVHIRTTKNRLGQTQLDFSVDGEYSSYAYSAFDEIKLNGNLYIGGLPESVFKTERVRNFLSSKSGYRGCLASFNLGRFGIPNLVQSAASQSVSIIETCTEILTMCTPASCKNGGKCYDHPNNATTWCDCSMTGYARPTCEDEPLGFYFRPDGRDYGMLVYKYPFRGTKDHEVDEIVMGVMTEQKDGVLARLQSGTFDDFIEFRLENGYVKAIYETNGKNLPSIVHNSDVFVSDGKYHIIRFVRTENNATLYVDKIPTIGLHPIPHGRFDSLRMIYIGGLKQGEGIVEGSGFDGIIGGLYINGHLVLEDAEKRINTIYVGDVNIADHPFKLRDIIIVPPKTTPLPPTPGPVPEIPLLPGNVGGNGILWTPGGGEIWVYPPSGIPVIPDDIGGGGMLWSFPGGGGGGGGGGVVVDVAVFPGGSGFGGSVGQIVPPVTGGGGGGVLGAQVAAVPAMPITGPRAGAVMGTILGLMALASSLMWAFYRCKPGWCACLKPPAAVPINISSPRGTNMGAVQAVSNAAGAGGAGGAGAGGAGAGGAGAGLDAVDGGITGGTLISGSGGAGGEGGSNSYFYSQQQTTNTHHRGESYDSATLRAMGAFSNKGTAIGTPHGGRAQFGSTTSASGYSVTENNVMTPASLQSYHFEGGQGTADYDVATGVHSNYQSNTLPVGGGGGAGGGFSTSTMSSNYNYSVKTIKTVGGQQQMLGYAGGSTSNVIVTPGAMGEEIRVDCCLMTNDGHSVVTGSSLGPPQVWNMTTGELLRIMQGETVGSTNLHLVNGDRLLVGAINADLEINQYSVPKGVHNYVFQIWDFATGRPLEMANFETCSALTVMSDNDKVVFGRSDKFGGGTNIVVWDLMANEALKEMRYDAPVGNNDYISYLSLSQNDRYVVSGFTNTFDNFAEFVIFDMTLTSSYISDPNILRLDAVPECTAILPRDEAVTGLRNGDLVVWSLRTGQPSRQLMSNNGKHAHSREVKAVARSQDNKYLVSASTDGSLKLWDLESERHICTMNGHNDEVWCAAISADNEIVVSGSRDGTIRLWRLRSGQEICAFNAGVDVFYITMSQDKGTIVALGDKYGARKLIMLQVVRSKVKRQVLA